jgi:hypothetical protein
MPREIAKPRNDPCIASKDAKPPTTASLQTRESPKTLNADHAVAKGSSSSDPSAGGIAFGDGPETSPPPPLSPASSAPACQERSGIHCIIFR